MTKYLTSSSTEKKKIKISEKKIINLNMFKIFKFPLTSSVSDPKSSRSKGMAATTSMRNQPLK